MKRLLLLFAILAVVAVSPALAETEAELKAAYENAVKLATAAPQDYTLNWQAARAARSYGDYLVVHQTTGWKETARAAAKEGMKYGEIAFNLNPSGIEGWYYYGLCVGTYSDCVSINSIRPTTMADLSLRLAASGRFYPALPARIAKKPKNSSMSTLPSLDPLPKLIATPGISAANSTKIQSAQTSPRLI